MNALLKKLRNKHTLVFIDFEATQFSHEIIASGLVKCHIDDEGKIISKDEGILIYTKPRSQIGSIVTKITSISEEFIKQNGISWKDTIQRINEYVGEDLSDILFVCFGSNDPRMIVESNRFSHPDNTNISKEWLHHFFDFMTFFGDYIRDKTGNTYSLVNSLKLFSLEPIGSSHNPLNDAIDLMRLYDAFINNPEIVFEEYQKVLFMHKHLPQPIKEVITKLSKGEDVSVEDFQNFVKKTLA